MGCCRGDGGVGDNVISAGGAEHGLGAVVWFSEPEQCSTEACVGAAGVRAGPGPPASGPHRGAASGGRRSGSPETGPERVQGHARLQCQGQPELPEPHRPRPAGPGQSQNETWMAVDPNNANHLVASYNDYRRGDGTCGVSYSLDAGQTLGRLHHPQRVHPGRPASAPPGSTGRPAATPRSPGTPAATPTCPARCSTAAPAPRPTLTSPARSTCTAPPAPTARRSTSRAARSPSTTTSPAPATSCWTSSC